MTNFCASAILIGLITGGLAVWIYAVRQLMKGQPVAPREPRCAVPWSGFHVVTLIFLYVGLNSSLPPMFVYFGQPTARPEVAAPDTQNLNSEHVISQLLQERHGTGVVLLCLAAAGLAAPLAEEFLFRLVIQGWLEKKGRQLRRWMPCPRRTASAMPIVLVAVVFAGIHFRMATPSIHISKAIWLMAGVTLANFLMVLIGITWLKLETGATAADLGFVPNRLAADIRTGLLAYLALSIILFPLQASLSRLLPAAIAPDSFALAPFALLVGWLYYRTHRLVPSIVVHMSLNITSLIIAVLSTN